MRFWFEYVPSEQNVADLPSRVRWDEMYEVLSELCCDEWTCLLYEVRLPDFSSWTAPLFRWLTPMEKKRHGSRGAKRRRGAGRS